MYLTKIDISKKENDFNNRTIFSNGVEKSENNRIFVKENSIVCYDRWLSNEHGTISREIFIFRTGSPGDKLDKIPGIKPGAILITHMPTNYYSKKLLSYLDTIRESGVSLSEIPEDYFLYLGGRILANVEAKIYKNINKKLSS